MSENTNWPAVEELPRDTLGLRIIPPKYPFWNEALEANREDLGSLLSAVQNNVTALEIEIPAEGWETLSDATDGYTYRLDLTCSVSAVQWPFVNLHKDSLAAAGDAGLCPSVETHDGFLRFWAKHVPDEGIAVTVTFFRIFPVQSGGTAYKIATNAEVSATINDIFG